MRNFLIILGLFFIAFGNAYGQEAGKFRFDISLGYAAIADTDSDGLTFYLEPKWTLNNRMNVGLRIGGSVIGKEIGEDAEGDFAVPEVAFSGSYVGTFDYYFHKSGSAFAPFVGAGFGYYEVANVETENAQGESVELKTDSKAGGLVRLGFDWYKFRLGFEYNLIPTSDLRDLDNVVIGTSKNNYYGVSLGFYFGGGKWKRN
ncbi:hypothetical protein EAX61_13610 [Dokdonia sinensis]|uniref:Outer membrane protein beta-barrel domain-containing protein n=1 Tax=Dokdonia sinensis TaxID=2479847 RepID=A0A3M0FXH5_9FLAO|nr:OmpW family outer membrane protein [Dokdonia sinensis]RMB56637.1 hypothetical protein EAX61_13610 [Dokdonia sinensis]